MQSYSLGFIPVESLHLVGTAQHVAPVFSELLQGPPAIIQLLHTKQSVLDHSLHSFPSAACLFWSKFTMICSTVCELHTTSIRE